MDLDIFKRAIKDMTAEEMESIVAEIDKVKNYRKAYKIINDMNPGTKLIAFVDMLAEQGMYILVPALVEGHAYQWALTMKNGSVVISLPTGYGNGGTVEFMFDPETGTFLDHGVFHKEEDNGPKKGDD